VVGRGAITGGIVAALVVGAAVAFGASTDARIHRLHLPPPPTVDGGSGGDISRPVNPGNPNPSNPSDPSVPVTPSPPASPVPPVTPTPPPATGVTCTMNTGETTGLSATAQLTSDLTITGLPASVSGSTLRFRGVNISPGITHNLDIRATTAGAPKLCGTANLANTAAETFTISNLPPGTYQLYCSIHLPSMVANITVNP
jgi:hypothetical protein